MLLHVLKMLQLKELQNLISWEQETQILYGLTADTVTADHVNPGFTALIIGKGAAKVKSIILYAIAMKGITVHSSKAHKFLICICC